MLSGAAADITDTGVTVTGGSGTAYLLPTFRMTGSFNDANASVGEAITACAGNGTCLLATPAFTTGGIQAVNVLFTPGIDATTSFQFGSQFTIDYSFAIFTDIPGFPQATPGGPVTADFTNGIQLVSMMVVDANGQVIPNAVIHSDFLSLATAPEPGCLLLCAMGLSLGMTAVKKKVRQPIRSSTD